MNALSRSTAFPAALFVALTGFALSLHGQQRPTDTIGDTVDVRLINVDVVVTDKRGNPVSGLTRSDFRLTEDRKDVDISHFSFVQPKRENSRSSGQLSTSDESTAASVTQPLTSVLYLDLSNTYPQNRQRIRGDLEQYLQQTDMPSRWILASYRDRLTVHSDPVLNPERLLEQLPSDAERNPRAAQSRLNERQTYSQIRDSYVNCENQPFCVPCFDNWDEMLSYGRNQATAERTRAQVAMGGIADLLGALSGLPGRKEVLYVGDGFHQRAGMATFSYIADLCPERPQAQNEIFSVVLEYDSTTQMKELIGYANSNRVTMNMLDATGVHTGMRSSVDFASSRFAPTIDNDRLRMENIQGAHYLLADETGGKALLNSNRPLGALIDFDAQIAAGAYSLGFTPTHPPSGRKHLLKVELVGKAAKGRRLRYRHSYQDKKLEAQLVDQLVSGLYFEDNDNPLAVRAEVGQLTTTSKKTTEVPVTVTLNREAFLQLPAQSGQARIWLRAVSDRGARSAVRQTFIEVPAATDDTTIETVVVRMTVETGGNYTIAVGVRDEFTQEVSVVRTSVDATRTDS